MKYNINILAHFEKICKYTIDCLLSLAVTSIMLSCINNGMDDTKIKSQSFLGTPCQHNGCICNAFRGHINLNGDFYGDCKDCGHSYEEHGIIN